MNAKLLMKFLTSILAWLNDTRAHFQARLHKSFKKSFERKDVILFLTSLTGLFVAFMGLSISVTALILNQIPVINLSYQLNHFNIQNLEVYDNQGHVSYDTAFELLITVINNGNEPAAVNSVDVFLAPMRSDHKPINSDCDMNEGPQPVFLHLFEHSDIISDAARGTDREANFGNKVIPPFAVSPYNTVQDLHRFSLFDQLNRNIIGIKGIVCLDVSVTTVDGGVYHRPKVLGTISARRGVMPLKDKDWIRINPPTAPKRPNEDSYGQQANLPGLQSELMILYRNRYWKL